MARKLYPIGIQTFEEIRRLDNLYIDKTEYVYRMTHTSGKYFFLSRPRRFGKSLLISTFQSYFEGKKDLFKGLAIEKQEKEWNEYPASLQHGWRQTHGEGCVGTLSTLYFGGQ